MTMTGGLHMLSVRQLGIQMLEITKLPEKEENRGCMFGLTIHLLGRVPGVQ